MSIFIIAEVGVNHNGDVALAKRMIDGAKEAGADCVKFQTFKAEEFVSDSAQTYTYKSQGKEITESMIEMFKRYEFNENEWREIVAYCKDRDIVFSSTAQNSSDLDFLLSITELPFIKVGSDDLTNLNQLRYYASKKLPMIISAGMAYAYEIEDAVNTIREELNNDITVLHCVSSYPTKSKDVNLKKIPTIRDAFGVKVGFSDHTQGSSAAVGAVCFGASVIEKHFTLDHNLAGPDHWFSSNQKELKAYIDDIRFIEDAIGMPLLKPTKNELKVKEIARRKIVAKFDLPKGTVLTFEMIDFKRCAIGLDPKEYKYIDKRILKDEIKMNKAILLKDLNE